ncbi:MAG: hypothetical protein A2527_14570 [Candidatus Lambdaproteobacteria bacterium RIFOXYD2_FULL_50_16]|uniref:Carrier domain-containing protein n=1 Tax=Candidatus Lambdaproteobacteria bacterium RIFOXYD2_FULL_50_16 TaxID=1817772 RepID=A0A1F6G844_9PROT|nr:MAG: hypothetical protein A2527_14570 [Candidatus Lambdaproteobacteria bacterium RIFOXYD2_FULL_50_16]
MNFSNWSNSTIVAQAKGYALSQPDSNFVTFLVDGDLEEASLSYAQLDQRARQIAGWLQAQGCNKGDRAVVMLPNGLSFIEVFFGCLYAGVVALPLSHQLLAYQESLIPKLETASPKLIIGAEQVVGFLNKRLAQDFPQFASLQVTTPQAIIEAALAPFSEVDIFPQDPAYLQFSSGSTGKPKGIVVGHSNIMANMEQSRLAADWQPGAGTALWLPLFHDFGLAAGLLGALYMGGFVILLTPAQFVVKPSRWLSAMSRYRCAHSYAPPFAFAMCIRMQKPEELASLNLSSMRSIVIGAEPVHYQATLEFNQFYAPQGLGSQVLRPGFGMAETVIMFSMSKGLEALCVDRHLIETKGRLQLVSESLDKEDKKYLVNLGPQMPEHLLVIKDDQNRPLPEGVVGEICLSGPSVCQGYYHNPEATSATFGVQIEGFEPPFLVTGDRGLLYQGNLYFTGRIKDLIIIRGRNYYPHDLEFVLGQVPEACPDCVMAYAITSEDAEEKLGLALEIDNAHLKDQDSFYRKTLPLIDKQVVKLMADHFQIYPASRTYLRPGTIKKTSSGKIKHSATQELIEQSEFHGLLTRFVDTESIEEIDGADPRETLIQLFRQITKLPPIFDEPIVDIGTDSLDIVNFLTAIEAKFPIEGFDIFDEVDDKTTLNKIIELITAHY